MSHIRDVAHVRWAVRCWDVSAPEGFQEKGKEKENSKKRLRDFKIINTVDFKIINTVDFKIINIED